jgi:CRP/FNR family transcriptional regulator, dissimilatory nitrate respiration regulator
MQTRLIGPSGPQGKRLALLSHVAMFRDLPPEDLARIAVGTTEVHAERGKVLFQRGDPCVGFHVVIYGQVKLSVSTPGGDEKVVDIVGPGQSFGEALMFTERPYVVGGTALADSLLLHVAKDTLFAEIERDPKLARRMLAGLSARLHVMVKDVEALSLKTAAQRVVGYLLSLGEEDAASVTLPAQKSLVASRLNLTPEYFSRILHELGAAKLIRIEGREIAILDRDGLRRHEMTAE